MTNRLQEAFFASAPGRPLNPDNAWGLQCVDVADAYAEAIFPGLSFMQTIGGVVGAKDFAGRNNKYFKWIPNRVGDLSWVPMRGDIPIFAGSAYNEWGHVAVCLSADAYNMKVIQQDGFLQNAAHIATLPYDGAGTGPCTGWLRPLVSADVTTPPAAPSGKVRRTGAQGVKERVSPTTSSAEKRVFDPGVDLTFKGYVKATGAGSDPYGDKNNVWFVGAFSGTYFHSSGFVGGANVSGLTNLTPKAPTVKPTLSPTQRLVGADGVNKRSAPDHTSKLVETYSSGATLNFTGWIRGTRPYGSASSDVWFIGTSGGYLHSSGLIGGANTAGLSQKAAETPATPAPAPTPAYTFAKRWASVTKVAPAAAENFQRGNFPARPTHLIVHQMDSVEAKPTLAGTSSWFGRARPDAPTSAHFGAEGKELWAFVDTIDRAYHAGAVGNNYLSVEVPPNPSPETIETVKRFLREWRDKMGYELALSRHKEVPGNATECGMNIPLDAFSIAGELAPKPTPEPAPAPDKTAEERGVRSFLDWLFGLWRTSRK